MKVWTNPELGARFVNIATSINRYIKTYRSLDVDITTYSSVQPTLKTLDEMYAEALAVEAELTPEIGSYPYQYLKGILRSFKTYLQFLQGDDLSYEVLQRDIQQLPITKIPQAKIDALKLSLDDKLGKKGYAGTVYEKINAWVDATKLAPEEVVPRAKAIIGSAKKATLLNITPLPEHDEISQVNPITGVFWSGLSEYHGQGKGSLTFNIERSWPRDVFTQVLTHEAYPGHQTFYCLWDDLFLRGLFPLEASYYLINLPNNSLFEGAPESGISFLDWDDDSVETPGVSLEEKRDIQLAGQYLDLQRIAQTNACYMVNVDQVSKAEAIDYMINQGCFRQLEAENTYRYFTHPIQKIYYPTYYHGKQLVMKSFRMFERAKRGEFYDNLYNHPHTNETYIESIKQLTGQDFNPFL